MTIRRTQNHLTRAVAVFVPVAVGIAIMGRAELAAVAPPAIYASNVEVTNGTTFADLPIRYEVGSDGRLLLTVESDLEMPTTILYLDNAAGDSLSDSAIVLGCIWGPASFSFALPANASSNATLKIYSLADGTVAGTADLPNARS